MAATAVQPGRVKESCRVKREVELRDEGFNGGCGSLLLRNCSWCRSYAGCAFVKTWGARATKTEARGAVRAERAIGGKSAREERGKVCKESVNKLT